MQLVRGFLQLGPQFLVLSKVRVVVEMNGYSVFLSLLIENRPLNRAEVATHLLKLEAVNLVVPHDDRHDVRENLKGLNLSRSLDSG